MPSFDDDSEEVVEVDSESVRKNKEALEKAKQHKKIITGGQE